MRERTNYYTPSLANSDNGIWCAYKEVCEDPRNRIWLGRVNEEGISPVDGAAPEAERMKLYLDGVLAVTQSHPDTGVAQGGAPLWVWRTGCQSWLLVEWTH